MGNGRLNARHYRIAAACVLAAYACATASRFTQGGLALDDASTFLVALRPLVDIPALAVSFQAQPPLFYLALHAWLRLGDSEPVLRVLPLIFMLAAAATLLATRWLTPLTRVVAVALLLMTPFSAYLTTALRPYSLSAWLSLWSCLLLVRLLRRDDPRAAPAALYAIVTVCMAYSVAMTSWTLLAQGICLSIAVAAAAARQGVRRALAQHARLLVSLSLVAALYLPYVIAVWRLQGALGAPSLTASLGAALNPRYFVSGPVYLLTLPVGLGYVALAAAAYAAWSGAVRRDTLVGVLVTIVVVQISLTHGFLEGRSGFSFRYLAPAYPALCLLAGLGIDRLLSRVRMASAGVAVCAGCLFIAAAAAFVRAPQPPVGTWRHVRADLQRLPGTKLVFFDVGWDAMRLQYEVRHDSDVRIMSDAGTGWNTGGRSMTPEYVTRAVDQHAGPGRMFFYEFDPVSDRRVFDAAFAPAMQRHRCVRVYQRDVPTYSRNGFGEGGALLYGYACDGV